MNFRAIILATTLALQALAATAAAPAAVHDGQHDFDFQFGTWKVHAESLVHPLSGSKAWVSYDGTHVVDKIWGGKANIGVLEISGSAGHVEGQSVRLYNPKTHQWSFTFASSSAGTLGAPMFGEFKNGRGEFFKTDTYNERAVYVRSVTSDITPTSYRDEYAYSADGGKTWETNWIATYVKVSNSVAPSASVEIGDAQHAAGWQHDWDFNYGTWHTHIMLLNDPFAHPTAWVEYNGTVVVSRVWRGRSSLEQIEANGPKGSHFEFITSRLYNRQAHQWSQNGSDSSDGVIEQPPLIGEFHNGVGAFYDQELRDGRAVFARQIWFAITPTSYRMTESVSNNGGRTWVPEFVAKLNREK